MGGCSDPVSLLAGFVDLPAAAVTVLTERLDLVLLTQLAHANARFDRAEQIPRLHRIETLLLDFPSVLVEQLLAKGQRGRPWEKEARA